MDTIHVLMQAPRLLWIAEPSRTEDLFVEFRGTFKISKTTEIRILVLGAHWYRVHVDDEFLTSGPPRFPATHPEYEVFPKELMPGMHVVSATVHNEGVSTRLLRGDQIPPFFLCHMPSEHAEIEIDWVCREMEEMRRTGVRVNPQLGWSEFHGRRSTVESYGWQPPAVLSCANLGELRPCSTGHVHHYDVGAELVSETRAMDGTSILTYDLGRIALYRPKVLLDSATEGSIAISYSEQLVDGIATSHIPLSCGESWNSDSLEVCRGRLEYAPFSPRGMRYFSVKLGDTLGPEIVQSAKAEKRAYYQEPEGSFECDDPLLNRIWRAGADTLCGCTEDAITDNPTRERGQWTGDFANVGMELCSVCWADMRPVRRGLYQAAWCAREDGLAAGLSPGGTTYLSTYALQWVNACRRYFVLTGDVDALADLHPFAQRNMQVFLEASDQNGLHDICDTWKFVDWGYDQGRAPTDLCFNIMFMQALETMCAWQRLLQVPQIERYSERAEQIMVLLGNQLNSLSLEQLGYHAVTMALQAGLVHGNRKADFRRFIRQHWLSSFPNNPIAPQLSSPDTVNEKVVTPYFAHFAFPPLIEAGEMEFVLEQYRSCWGWALGEERTTMLEVFDTNWSHCHQWSCCPTWQLSRYVLGLHPRLDLGLHHYELNLRPGNLRRAHGRIPAAGLDGTIGVDWSRTGDSIEYRIESPGPVMLHVAGRGKAELIEGKRVLRF